MSMSKIQITIFLVVFMIVNLHKSGAHNVIVTTSDSTLLNGFSITEFISKNGYPVEIHKNIPTEDNYLLTVHRIPHGRSKNTNQTRPAVLLMHGMQGSGPNWIIMGPSQSLSFVLADQGYDVWMGNARGTTYSKNHQTLNANRDDKFWDFSWHEIGYYDLPAMIQYILDETKQKRLYYVGHSQGTTAFFVMTSTRPGMNHLVKLMVALAPGVFYMPIKMPLKSVAESSGSYAALEWGRRFLRLNQMSTVLTDFTCAQPVTPLSGQICDKFYKALTRTDLTPAESERCRKMFPDSCSIRQVLHYVQLYASGEFGQYDFGKKINLKKYGSAVPPQYDLGKVSAPVALFMGQFDPMGLPLNVKRLEAKIQNVVFSHVIPEPAFNHFNFIIGNRVDELINKKVLNLFSQHQ